MTIEDYYTDFDTFISKAMVELAARKSAEDRKMYMILGTFIAPGVGTMVGAFVGGIAGALMHKSRVDRASSDPAKKKEADRQLKRIQDARQEFRDLQHLLADDAALACEAIDELARDLVDQL